MVLGNWGSKFYLEYLNTHSWVLINPWAAGATVVNPRRACAARKMVMALLMTTVTICGLISAV